MFFLKANSSSIFLKRIFILKQKIPDLVLLFSSFFFGYELICVLFSPQAHGNTLRVISSAIICSKTRRFRPEKSPKSSFAAVFPHHSPFSYLSCTLICFFF